jgi:hypothetical protein
MSSGILCLALAAAAAAPWDDGRSSWPITPPTVMDRRIAWALGEPVDIDLHDATLKQAVDVLQARFEIPIRLSLIALEDEGVDESTPAVTHRDMSLGSTLDQLLEPLNATYCVEDESIVITSWSDAEYQLTTRIDDVTGLVDEHGGDFDFDPLIDLITSTIASDFWDENGGEGAIEVYRSGGMPLFIIMQTSRLHLAIEDFLAQVRQVRRIAPISRWADRRAPTSTHLSPEPFAATIVGGPYAWPIRLASATEEKIEQVLRQPVDVEVREARLEEVADQLGDRFGIHIRLRKQALEDVGVGESTRVISTFRGITLASALAHLLDPIDATFSVDSDSLVITTKSDAESMQSTRIYDVSGLLGSYRGLPDFDSLIDAIVSVIEPDSWDENGGEGAIEPYQRDDKMLLVIAQTRDQHVKIEGLIEQLRRIAGVRSTASRSASVEAGAPASAGAASVPSRPTTRRAAARADAESPDWFVPRVHD